MTFTRPRFLPGLALFLLSAPALGVGSAAAADGLHLRWNDCPAGASPASIATFACDTDAGSHELLCSLTSAQPIDSVLGVDIVVDLQYSGPILPDWWHFEFGGCRFGQLVADDNFAGHAGCTDLWGGQAAGGLLSYTVGMPHGGANQARIQVAFSVLPALQKTINTTDVYQVARIVMSNGGTASCAGCSGSVCLVLNSITVRRPPRPVGAPGADVVITAPGSGNGNWVGWQMLNVASCQAVPVRNRTWGEVKALYR